MARRWRGVGGSVGGVLPLLTVSGSFVRRTRPVYSKRIPWVAAAERRAQRAAIIAGADQQHAAVLAGDELLGVYLRYPPAV